MTILKGESTDSPVSRRAALLSRAAAFARHPDALSVGFFALVAIVFCAPYLFGSVLLPADALYTAPPWKSFAQSLGVTSVHNELIADLVLQNLSWKQFIADSYASGQFPLWNPYLFAGTPFLAAGQYAALYPFGLLFYIMPVASAYGPFAALHLFFAGSFTYVYLRIIGVNRSGALVGGVVFELAGFLVVSFVWPMILSAAVWLPLGLAMCELLARHLDRGTLNITGVGLTPAARLIIPLGALSIACQLLAGHLEISFYFLFTLMVYSAVRLSHFLYRTRNLVAALRAGFSLLVMVAIGFSIAGAQLLPFFELIRENYRIGQVNYADVAGWALPKQHLLAFLIPDVFGNPTHHSYFDLLSFTTRSFTDSQDTFGNTRDYPFWGIKNYVEGAAYVGLLPLALSAVAIARTRNRYTVFFAVYAAVCLLLAFGTPLYRIVWMIPGVDQLHTPFRWVYPASFCFAVLAGVGAGRLTSILQSRCKLGVLVAPALTTYRNGSSTAREIGSNVVIDKAGTSSGASRSPEFLRNALLVAGGAVFAVLFGSRVATGHVLAILDQLRARSTNLGLAFPTAAFLYSYEWARLAGFGLMLIVAGGALAFAIRRPRFAGPVLASAVALDLMTAFIGFNTAGDVRQAQFIPPSLQKIKEDTGLFRITSFNFDDTLRPNSNMLAGLQDIRGYDTVIQRRFVDYWRLLEEPSGLLYSMINKLVKPESLQSPLLDLLNVKYVLTTQNISLPGWVEAYRGEINVYRNSRVLPRAFVTGKAIRASSPEESRRLISLPGFDPRDAAILESDFQPGPGGANPDRSTATVTRYSGNSVELAVNLDAPGFVVLTDSYFPGWRAYIDDQETPVLQAYSLFRAVEVPAGEHKILFKYAPVTFQIGGYLSLLGLFAVGLGLSYALWSALDAGGTDRSTVQRIFKNSIAPMATQLGNKFVDLAFAIVVARLLGPAAVGEYAFAVVLFGYFSIFTDFGLGTLLTREVARDRTSASRFLANIVGLRLVLCLISLPVLGSIAFLYFKVFNLTNAGLLTIAFFAISLFPSAISATYSAVFYAFEKMEYPAILSSISTILKVILGLIALSNGFGIAGLAAVSVIVNVATLVIFWRLLESTFFKPRWAFDSSFAKHLTVESFPLMINNFLSSIFFRIDVLILKPMQGDAVTGFYTTAYKFIDGLNFIPSIFTLAVFPIFSRLASSSTEGLRQGFLRSLKALLIISMPITVGTTILADQIVLLFFGDAFEPSILALRLLIWFLPFSYVNSVTHYVLIALNQQRYLTFAFLGGVFFNVVANILVIPTYGLAGASVVTVLSEIALLIPFFYGVRLHLGWLPPVRPIIRPMIATIPMAAVILLVRQSVPLPFTVLVAVAAYVPCLVVIGGLDSDDFALIRRLTHRKVSSEPRA